MGGGGGVARNPKDTDPCEKMNSVETHESGLMQRAGSSLAPLLTHYSTELQKCAQFMWPPSGKAGFFVSPSRLPLPSVVELGRATSGSEAVQACGAVSATGGWGCWREVAGPSKEHTWALDLGGGGS